MRGLQGLGQGDPSHVGAYRLVGVLGEGGQGVVYRGEGPGGAPVAVKVLHARFAGDARARSRFAGELAHAKRVAAFCTARVLDADADGDRPYIVSEYVDGPPLSEVISSGGPTRGPALDRLAIATVTALAAIHQAGVVHRDFKPGNVIMGADGPRVIDFGIARALDATGTLSSAVVGTPAYMAPEQISGAEVGPPADVFAWACTVVAAATGAAPFGQSSIPVVMHRILHEEPDLGPLSGPLRDIVAACLAKDPARRPTARQVLLRLLGGAEAPGDALLSEGVHAASGTPGRSAGLGAAEGAAPGLAPGAYGGAPPHSRPVTAEGTPPGSGPGAFEGTPPHSGPGAAGGALLLPPGSADAAGTPDATARLRPTSGPAAPGGEAGPRRGRRAMARLVAAAGFLLAAVTFVAWGSVGTLSGGMSIPIDVTPVAGLATVWGVVTLATGLLAMVVAMIDEFTRRVSAAWAALPGLAAVGALTAFWIRREDLHSAHPNLGMLSPDELRGLGARFYTSIAYGWYAALAIAVVLVVLALAAVPLRRK
ncbi:hypothetical protein GCM10009530_14980 [Microbispora corallina]|uniref:Protein kinase domain-containing protein n=1 Tax=Microbispora corallina TaxID=83302 RepID=A0ABQ4FXC2_9ACTN|nr:serine/threonine-protein kinase [Microbispora corallina]GIH39456.1 hypothetical protein Mco01_24560 [Microbispora corallina]